MPIPSRACSALLWSAIVLTATACDETKRLPTSEEATTPGGDTAPVIDLEATPSTLDFGEVPPGTSSALELVFVSYAKGATMYTESTLGSSSLTLTRRPPTPTKMQGEDPLVFEIMWTPVGFETLDSRFDLVFEMPDGSVRDVSIPVTGTTVGPILEVSATPEDVGAVWVGCAVTAILGLANAGNADLHVSEVTTSEWPGMRLLVDGAPLEDFPLTLAPDERLDVSVVFEPEGDVTGPLTVGIESDWALSPSVEQVFEASGGIWRAHTETFAYVPSPATSMIVAWNVGTEYLPITTSVLPAFFAAVPDDSRYRLVFVTMRDGVPAGDVAFLDSTYSEEESLAIAEEMLAQAAPTDNDALFDTTLAAVEAGRDWLIGESSAWAEGVLHVVGINNDLEQGSMNATTFLDAIGSAKGSVDLVQVHGIMGTDGDVACPTASPWIDASSQTGGTFFDYCLSDWEAAMASFGALLEGGSIHTLEAVPDLDTLVVTVDGTPWTEGWTYDEEENAIVFDGDPEPPDGAEIVVTYTPPLGCLE